MRSAIAFNTLGTLAMMATPGTTRPLVMPDQVATTAEVIEGRQLGGTSLSEFSHGGCRPNIFFFSRGTGEPGNMVNLPGPQT